MLLQGVPFMRSGAVRTNALDAVGETAPEKTTANSVKNWTSLLSTSIVATYLSQSLHNCQIAMQADQSLNYRSVLIKVWTEHGVAVLYRGAEPCVGFLLIVNVLNELLLKPAWAPLAVDAQ